MVAKRTMVMLIIAILALLLLLAACGSNNAKENASEPTASPAENSASDKTVSNETSAEKVKLSITSWRANVVEDKVYEKIQEGLNKMNSGIELEYKPVKATEYNTALNTALKTDSAADIIHLRPYAGARALAEAGYLEPIDGLPGLDQYPDDFLNAATGPDNKRYGVPYMLSSTLILYNKEIFEKYNLKEPQTWQELLQIADTLKANKVTPFAFGSKEGWVLSLAHGAVGPQFFGNDFRSKLESGEAKFTSPEFIKSIEAMKSLVPYFPDHFTGLGMDDIRTMFATGQTGMVIDGHFEIASILDLNPDLKIGAFPVPAVEADGTGTVATWVDGSFGINVKSKNKEAAKKYLEFLTTKEYGSIIMDYEKSPTPIKGVAATDPLVNEITELSSNNGTPYLAVTFLNSGNPTTKVTLENALQGMYLGKLTPEEVANEVQKSFESWFKPSK